MNKKLVFGVIALIAIIIVGAVIYGFAMREMTPADTGITAADLNGKTFRITSLDGIEIPIEQEYLVEFADDSISTKICNLVSGGFNVVDNIITANLAKTLMFCDEPGVMDIEVSMTNFLSAGASVNLSDNTLTLSKDDRDLVLTQVQMP